MFYVVVLLQADGDDKNVARLEGGKEFLKQEFVNAAYQSFLAGKDPGLDYAPLRFWWTKSPFKSPQKSARASRPTQKRALESKCTLLSAQKRAPIFCLAPKRAQEIAQKSKTLKKAL